MSFRSFRRVLAVAALVSGLSCFALGEDVALKIQEDWGGVLGGTGVTFHVELGSPVPFPGRLTWRLSAQGRTISRGEAAVDVPQDTTIIEVPLDIPEVKGGVIMEAMLSVGLLGADASQVATNLDKPLWIFPTDPFSERKQWLEDLKIHLFDPEEKTTEVFEDLEIPFEPVRNVDALPELRKGMIIVGEGVSFEDYRGLPESMTEAAANGLPVLCLAPTEGQMSVPGTSEAELPQPASVQFRRSDIITELDKRLDAVAWPSRDRIVARTMVVSGERSGVVGEVVDDESGWPWLEVGFGERQGKLIVCGFAIVEAWDSGPTPRFLLARILEYMTEDEGEKEEER